MQFVAIRKIMDKLNRIHGIATSENEIIMEWLYTIEGQTGFEDESKEWRENTMNNGFHDFVRFFTDRDKRVRRLAKLQPKAAVDAGYSSVTNIRGADLEECMIYNINDGLTALALAMDESLNQAVAANEAKSPTPPASRDRYCSPTTARAPSPTTSTDTAILKTFKAMEARIIATEKCGANRRECAERVIDPNATKCKHCGRVHIRPNSECWDLEANSHRHPANWKNSKKE